MRRPDLSDLLLAIGLAVAIHAVYRWSPVIAEALAGVTLAALGVTLGALKATKKRSP